MGNPKRIDATVDRLRWYRESVRFALYTGSAPGIRKQREQLEFSLPSEQELELRGLDIEALEDILELDWVDPDLLMDKQDAPLYAWWWHLGKIRAHSYPAELLTNYLQPVYQQAQQA